jgi:hypothetical protein
MKHIFCDETYILLLAGTMSEEAEPVHCIPRHPEIAFVGN